MCAKLRTMAASNNRDHACNLSYYCLPALEFFGVILHAHPVRGESHNQRNTTGEVATSSPSFYNEPHRSHVLCVKDDPGTTFTSWSQLHFVAIGYPERHVRKASQRGSKQQHIMLAISHTIACSRYIYYGVILHAHRVRGESHNQRNTTGEVATEHLLWRSISIILVLCMRIEERRSNRSVEAG